VLRAADAACYSAKECGGNRVRLEFEIAESAALTNLPQAVRFFAAIRGIGCGMRSGCWGLATLRGVPWPLQFR
jgi:hypothetical protein